MKLFQRKYAQEKVQTLQKIQFIILPLGGGEGTVFRGFVVALLDSHRNTQLYRESKTDRSKDHTHLDLLGTL